MQYTNLDVIETDFIIEAIFNGFEESPPLSDRFEEVGYESSNFFLLIGALLLLTIAFMVCAPIRKCLQLCSLKFGDNFITRRFKPDPEFRSVILTFFYEGVVEL
eukprot:CAMPEP_0185575188 /NCGR_PEP_ID=MMETSP0434-20130131/6452_1 /TAXON_ID=626734 ORGANISM="Favella taraikaensis, Strain Fe Narragansett Bay" /NCGR_SAMPLE_ID=MMETSP0434 /ASSEMBLY_ACC=CAM_ASM_000379 /LENGTH=103 /DNA_ID=CAMNT_0028191995 /DNA_START=73 /DNA_END=380 /DNA_ORIENTATION=-